MCGNQKSLATKDRGVAVGKRKGRSRGRAASEKSKTIAPGEPTVLRRLGWVAPCNNWSDSFIIVKNLDVVDLNAKRSDCRKRRQKHDEHFDGRSIRRRILWSLRLATVRRENGCNAHNGGHWRWIFLQIISKVVSSSKIKSITILLFLLINRHFIFHLFQKLNHFRRRINLLGESRV